MEISFYLFVSCVIFFITLYVLLYLYNLVRTKCNIKADKDDIMIFAPHPDDCVIMAGGYAIQTKRNGGNVKVVYLNNNADRLNEAYAAWRMIGLKEEDLIPLSIADNGRLNLKDVDSKVKIIGRLITEFNPKIIFVPLYEGGHIEHDRTNYLVSRAVESLGREIKLYECPEYNYFFSFKHTPEKFLDIFSKLIPFFEYHAPPSFIDSSGALYLCMSKVEVETKKQMLGQFVSQMPETLEMHFRFNDRFKIYTEHNYYLPPHNYGNMLVKKARHSKNKLLCRFFSRPYWYLDTIHRFKVLRPLSPLLQKK